MPQRRPLGEALELTPEKIACNRSRGVLGGEGWLKEGGGRSAGLPGAEALGERIEQMSALLAASGGDAEDPLDESAARRAVRAEAALSPENGMTQRPLGGVVGRLDSLTTSESPKPKLVLQELAAGRLSFRAARVGAAFEFIADLASERNQIPLERRASHRSVPHSVPPFKENVRKEQQFFANWSAFSAAINHRLEISTQMRPTKLHVFNPKIAAEAIANGHAGKVLAEQFLGHAG